MWITICYSLNITNFRKRLIQKTFFIGIKTLLEKIFLGINLFVDYNVSYNNKILVI